jgi:hypothetical protein
MTASGPDKSAGLLLGTPPAKISQWDVSNGWCEHGHPLGGWPRSRRPFHTTMRVAPGPSLLGTGG